MIAQPAESSALERRLAEALRSGREKLATYQAVYPGDKELRRLLTEWDAVLASPEAPAKENP